MEKMLLNIFLNQIFFYRIFFKPQIKLSSVQVSESFSDFKADTRQGSGKIKYSGDITISFAHACGARLYLRIRIPY